MVALEVSLDRQGLIVSCSEGRTAVTSASLNRTRGLLSSRATQGVASFEASRECREARDPPLALAERVLNIMVVTYGCLHDAMT